MAEERDRSVSPGPNSRRWTKEEDDVLIECVKIHQVQQTNCWLVSQKLPFMAWFHSWVNQAPEILTKQSYCFYQGRNWKKVAESFCDRSDVQCLHRWQKVLNPELIKGPWTKEVGSMLKFKI